nr:hypothetical protein CFP56_16967 [Quercus suber]
MPLRFSPRPKPCSWWQNQQPVCNKAAGRNPNAGAMLKDMEKDEPLSPRNSTMNFPRLNSVGTCLFLRNGVSLRGAILFGDAVRLGCQMASGPFS